MEFSNNSAITSFDELGRFTNAQNIPASAFANDTALESIHLSKVTSLDYDAFRGCTSLVINDLSLPNLEILGRNAFYGVSIKKISNLGKITALPDSDYSSQHLGKRDVTEEIILPETLTSIPDYSFAEFTKLTKCYLPKSLISIGDYAFDYAPITGIIDLPNLEVLGSRSFWNAIANTNIEGVENLGKITSIHPGVFQGNFNLRYAKFPNTVTYIYRQAVRNCPSLEYLLFNSVTPPTLEQTSAFDNTNNCPIYVPDASVEAYKTATNWSAYADRIMSKFYYLGYIDFADPAVRDICVANFDTDADGVVSMEEAAAVTDIGTLFQNNKEITSFDEFKYFTGVTKLSANVFSSMNLQTISIPINAYFSGMAFSYSYVENIIWYSENTSFNSLWQHLSDIQNIIVPESNSVFASIDGALYSKDLTALYAYPVGRESAVIADGCTSILSSAFRTAVKATGVLRIPSSVIQMETLCFSGLANISMIMESSTPAAGLKNNAFSGTSFPIYVPDASVDVYKTTGYWTQVADRIKPLSEYVEE